MPESTFAFLRFANAYINMHLDRLHDQILWIRANASTQMNHSYESSLSQLIAKKGIQFVNKQILLWKYLDPKRT